MTWLRLLAIVVMLMMRLLAIVVMLMMTIFYDEAAVAYDGVYIGRGMLLFVVMMWIASVRLFLWLLL